MLTEDERDEEDDGRVPRAAERRKVRSGRERVDVSSLGVMYCMDDELLLVFWGDDEDHRLCGCNNFTNTMFPPSHIPRVGELTLHFIFTQ